MEIFLQLLDELDDLVLSIASYWETITAGFYPSTVLATCTAILLSTALVALDRHYETFERSPS
jgi:hypothetical protein